jgi:hypothetical protein
MVDGEGKSQHRGVVHWMSRTRLMPAAKLATTRQIGPIDDRDRVESLSRLPRHFAVAIP